MEAMGASKAVQRLLTAWMYRLRVQRPMSFAHGLGAVPANAKCARDRDIVLQVGRIEDALGYSSKCAWHSNKCGRFMT